MPKTITPALTDVCDGCRNPNAVFYPDRCEYLCPQCGEYIGRGELAEDHLINLLEPLGNIWHAHWRARGLGEQEAREVLEFVASNHLLPNETPQA